MRNSGTSGRISSKETSAVGDRRSVIQAGPDFFARSPLGGRGGSSGHRSSSSQGPDVRRSPGPDPRLGREAAEGLQNGIRFPLAQIEIEHELVRRVLPETDDHVEDPSEFLDLPVRLGQMCPKTAASGRVPQGQCDSIHRPAECKARTIAGPRADRGPRFHGRDGILTVVTAGSPPLSAARTGRSPARASSSAGRASRAGAAPPPPRSARRRRAAGGAP